MAVYFVLFFVVAIFSVISSDRHLRALSPLFSGGVAVLLFAISGFRSEAVGADYLSYKQMFYSFSGFFDGGLKEVIAGQYFFEPGFALLIVFLKTFTNNYVYLFLGLAFFIVSLIFWSLKRISEHAALSFLVYYSYLFFTHGFVAIRFGLASSIALCFLVVLAERRYVLATSLFFLSLSIHSASVVLVVPLLLYLLRVKWLLLVAAFFASFVFGLAGYGELLLTSLPHLLPRWDSVLTYVSDDQYGESLGIFGLVNLKYTILACLIFWRWESLNRINKYMPLVLIFMLCSVFIRIAFHDLGFVVGRLSALLGLVEIVLIPSLVFSIFGRRMVSVFMIIVYCLINIVMLLYVRGFGPYSAVFT